MTARSMFTKRELARRLCCGPNKVYEVADQRGIPFDVAHGVSGDGQPLERRRYDRAAVEEYLMERARVAARRAAS